MVYIPAVANVTIPNPVAISAALEKVAAHQRAGRAPETQTVYRRVLAADPENAEANYLLGLIAMEGRAHAGWVATSLLRAVGPPEFVAASEDDYVAIAKARGPIPAPWRRCARACARG